MHAHLRKKHNTHIHAHNIVLRKLTSYRKRAHLAQACQQIHIYVNYMPSHINTHLRTHILKACILTGIIDTYRYTGKVTPRHIHSPECSDTRTRAAAAHAALYTRQTHALAYKHTLTNTHIPKPRHAYSKV